MTNRVRILSDYTPTDKPNILTIFADDQGDIHISMFEGKKADGEHGVRIAASGSRHTHRVREAFRNLLLAYKEELEDDRCRSELRELNDC